MTIDVHGHITSPELLARFPMPPSLGDVEAMIEAKAAQGITTTIVGSPVGAGTMVSIPGLNNYRQPADQLESFHDWLAEQVRAHPGRLRAYAYVNPHGGDAELAAAAKLMDREEFVGLIANSSVEGEFLDSAKAAGFFAMAAEHHAPIMLHPPAEPAGSGRLRDPRLVEHVARHGDVALGIAAVIFAGWLERHPGLRIIAPICGGGLPLLMEKLEIAYAMPRRGPGAAARGEPSAARPPREVLGRVYVDTATPSQAALSAALRLLGARNMLFGTDTPPMGVAGSPAAGLGGLGLSPVELALILRRNATELFGLDGAAIGASARKGAPA